MIIFSILITFCTGETCKKKYFKFKFPEVLFIKILFRSSNVTITFYERIYRFLGLISYKSSVLSRYYSNPIQKIIFFGFIYIVYNFIITYKKNYYCVWWWIRDFLNFFFLLLFINNLDLIQHKNTYFLIDKSKDLFLFKNCISSRTVNQNINMSNCLIRGISSLDSGGAIYIISAALSLIINETTFYNCSSTTVFGGAIFFENGSEINSKTFFYNNNNT